MLPPTPTLHYLVLIITCMHNFLGLNGDIIFISDILNIFY